MDNLNIDYKFSIEYETDSNDRPVRWMRYGEEWPASTKWEESNAVTAMFYRMLEDRAEITQLRAELDAYEAALEEIATYDTGATAGLAYTAQQALATRRNK